MAERSGLSKSTVGRIWKGFGLEPQHPTGLSQPDCAKRTGWSEPVAHPNPLERCCLL